MEKSQQGDYTGKHQWPLFFNIFLNDLHTASINNLSLIKFANHCSLLIAINEQIDNFEIALLQFRTHVNDMNIKG